MFKQAYKVLIANRGEIVIRIARAAAELRMESVSVYSEDDEHALHVRSTNQTIPLRGTGAAAYLDIEQIVTAAKESGCQAIHPGYGFISENPSFARACRKKSITFVGPEPETLELFGDKAKARAFAQSCGVLVPRGIDGAVSLESAREFMRQLGPNASIMIKETLNKSSKHDPRAL